VAGSLAFGTGGDYLHGRASTWRAAVETFADRPLAGAGADAFLAGSIRHQDGDTVVFAHDLPLELAAELGAAGFALAIALYAATAALIWRARATRAASLLGPAAAAFLAASLLDWPWHLAGSGAIFALSIGALAGAQPRARKFPPQTESKETHD
jgi:O-antigen ligase